MSSSQRGIQQPALSGPFNQNQRQNDTQQTFFAQANYARLLQPLREQYERKLNTDELPEDVDKRLQKSLQHYMKEVFRVNGTVTPINTLNQEVSPQTTHLFVQHRTRITGEPTPCHELSSRTITHCTSC